MLAVAQDDVQNNVVRERQPMPGRNGGTLYRIPKGESGNPGGRPKTKHITDALLKIALLDPEKLAQFKPKTMAEAGALAQWGRVGGSRGGTEALREIMDRLEGKAAAAQEDREPAEQLAADRRAALILRYLEIAGILDQPKKKRK